MTLRIGDKPDSLELSYSPGFKWFARMRLKFEGVPFTWPVAPILVFENGVTWTATLSDVVVDSVVYTNARATWDKTKVEVDALGNDGGGVKIVVGGVPYWSGQAIPNV